MRKKQKAQLICNWENNQEKILINERLAELISEASTLICGQGGKGAASYIIVRSEIAELFNNYVYDESGIS